MSQHLLYYLQIYQFKFGIYVFKNKLNAYHLKTMDITTLITRIGK